MALVVLVPGIEAPVEAARSQARLAGKADGDVGERLTRASLLCAGLLSYPVPTAASISTDAGGGASDAQAALIHTAKTHAAAVPDGRDCGIPWRLPERLALGMSPDHRRVPLACSATDE